MSGLLWKPEVLQGNWTACLNMAPCSISRCLGLTGKIAPSRRTLVNTVFPEQTTTFRCLCLQLVLEIYFCGFGPRSRCGSMFSTCKLVSIAGLGAEQSFLSNSDAPWTSMSCCSSLLVSHPSRRQCLWCLWAVGSGFTSCGHTLERETLRSRPAACSLSLTLCGLENELHKMNYAI